MIQLPSSIKDRVIELADRSRLFTIIGGNGVGKSLFMDEMMQLSGEKTYSLDALQGIYSTKEESILPGSLDSLYREATAKRSYMRVDAVSGFDKLLYMLYADEIDSLLELKEHVGKRHEKVKLRKTKLDIVQRNWERLFPGKRMERKGGQISFRIDGSDEVIFADSLSRGEKSALYLLGGVLYAMESAVIYVDSPTMFVHPSILTQLWNIVESLRPDCTFVYNSVNEEFISSRSNNMCIWVKGYDSSIGGWDYDVLGYESFSDELIRELAGTRSPVLFVEGDSTHSLDIKLYSLVFDNMRVRPLGSCDKVIETTRSFNGLKEMHHLESYGIVDRDRRTEVEVNYLRRKQIMVPNVAEIENIFLLPDVIKMMSHRRGRDGKRVMQRVVREIVRMFKRHSEEQTMEHVRHRVKRAVECKIDGRFKCITALETHLRNLNEQLQPRRQYNELREEFATMVRDEDYIGILRVFNYKPMLGDCGVHRELGFRTKEEYIGAILDVLKGTGDDSQRLRESIRREIELNIEN